MGESAPPPPALPAMSGFLPTASLVDSLVHESREVAAVEELPSLQRRNSGLAIRRVRLLAPLFEDLRDSGVPLPSSCILCLTELSSVVRKTKEVIEKVAAGSALWCLITTEHVAQQFHSCARELAQALDILPLSLLGISDDVREQVHLLYRQAKRADLYVDPRELQLRDELFGVMGINPKLGGQSHVISKAIRRGGHLDWKKAEGVMRSVGLRCVEDYQQEIVKLEAEKREQAGTGGLIAISNINNLIALLSHSTTSLVFLQNGAAADETTGLQHPTGTQPAATLDRSSSGLNSTGFSIPDEFRCPITLDLMKDPVIVTSGHTYDRTSIARWMDSGHCTCPKSGQRLIHMALIPNYSVKSMIDQWCKENNVPFDTGDDEAAYSISPTQAVDHIAASRTAMEAVRMTSEFLVGKLAMGSPDIQRQAAYELRLLAKTGMNNRRIIAEAGAIPFLITLLGSRDPRTQEDAVTALFNLSILDNNKILIMAASAIDAIIDVLKGGSAMEARENAAATIFSLTMLDECKATIGARPGAIAGLVGLLREGSAVGKKDAVTALFNLSLYCPNKATVVAAEAIPLLVELLMDEKAGVTDHALGVLQLLCSCGEGMREISDIKALVPILVDLLRLGSPKGKENSISILLGLCRDGGREMGKHLLQIPRSFPALQSLATSGSPKARRKADALLRLLNRCFSQAHTL